MALASCKEDCEPLTDEDLFLAALTYEVQWDVLPPEFSIGSPEQFLEENPDCCGIRREDHPFTPVPGILDWFFPYDTVYISIGIPSNIDENKQYITEYLVSPCGFVGDRFGQQLPVWR